jgi:hypothetical protein
MAAASYRRCAGRSPLQHFDRSSCVTRWVLAKSVAACVLVPDLCGRGQLSADARHAIERDVHAVNIAARVSWAYRLPAFS